MMFRMIVKVSCELLLFYNNIIATVLIAKCIVAGVLAAEPIAPGGAVAGSRAGCSINLG